MISRYSTAAHTTISARYLTTNDLPLLDFRIWRPSEDLLTVKEGEVHAVMGLEPPRELGRCPGRLHATALQLEAGRNSTWRRIARSVNEVPAVLRAHSMPRREIALSDMPAFAGEALAVSAMPQAAVFDFTGVVLKAGPLYQNADYTACFQWIFLADSTAIFPRADDDSDGKNGGAGKAVGGEAPQHVPSAEESAWLLAVKLEGTEQAVSWLIDGDDSGAVVTLKDLELMGKDAEHRVWQAVGGMHTATVAARPGAAPRRGCAEADAPLHAWVEENAAEIEALKARAAMLMQC